MIPQKLSPPKIAIWLLKRIVSKDIRYSALGDFEEIFASMAVEKSFFCARLWYWNQVAKSLPSFMADSIYWRIFMIRNYMKIALRKILRQKIFSFINIAGLAIGMAICILLLLWIQDELSYDKFHENAETICRVNMDDQRYGVTWPVVSIPVGPALEQEYPEIIASTRVSDFVGLIAYEDKKFDELGVYVDPSFFDIFSFPFISGDTKTALSSPDSIILTQGLAEKYFGKSDPLGQLLNINQEHDLRITGVIRNIPRNSHIQFKFLVPFEIFRQKDRDPTNWSRFQLYTYVQLQESVRSEEVGEKISGLLQKHDVRQGPKLSLEPLTKIYLYAADGGGDIRYIYVFSIIASFILVIACINFMNLTTARSSTRAKEIGMRKVTGAHRMELIRQFMGESVFIALIAAIFAVVLVIIILPAFNQLSDKQLTFNPQANSSLVLVLVAIVLLSGLLAGSYPALFLSSFKPVDMLKGSLIPSKTRAKKTIFRKALVVFQFSVSIFLMISTLVIFKQLGYIQNRNLGFQKDHVIYIPLRGEGAKQHEAFKAELLQDPRILHASAASELPTLIGKIHTGYEWEGKDPDKEARLTEVLVDHDFIQTMNMEMALGRDFSRDYTTDASGAFILNETALKTLEIEMPLGKRFAAPVHSGMREGTIVGVVRDFHFRPLHDEIPPLVMFIASQQSNYLCIRLNTEVSDLPGVLGYTENVWKKFAPNLPFKYGFLDETYERAYRSEQKTGNILGYFTALAIFISCLGLFGLTAQMTELRTKEIGIRKVLGATVPGVTLFLSKDFLKWVVFANLIAWPTAYIAMNKWLQNFAYRTSIGIDILILAALMAFVIALVTVSFQSIRAALTNPVDSLRYE